MDGRIPTPSLDGNNFNQAKKKNKNKNKKIKKKKLSP
jgi:hypothetical protein